jgi:hypothetical protein
MIPRPLHAITLSLVLAVLFAPHSFAQSPVDPGQLPARTSFYVLWRGTPSGDVRAKNSLYALWDDPDFAPARSALLASFLNQNQTPKDKSKPALTPQETAEYVTLLDNPFLVGYLRRPESWIVPKSADPKSTDPKSKPSVWNGTFLIYDRTGKEALLSKAVVRLRSADSEIPKLTNLTISGVPALKVERKSGTTYWSEFGKFAVSAQDQPVFEEIVALLNGKPAASLLSQVPAFVEAEPLLSGGPIEFFANVSNLKDLALNSASGGPTDQFKPFLNALKLDTLHCFAGHISLEGSRTRFQAAIIGDTVPDSLFDIFADGQVSPASMVFLFPDTLYYSESQVDLLGLYKVLKRAIAQAGGNSTQQVNLLDSMAATRLGMPLEDALGVTTGEFASLQSSPAFDSNQQVYFLGIRNKPGTLKLMRSLMGDRITSERNEGSTTFLKVSLQGGQSSTGVAQWNFYYLAMTSSALLGASKSDTLRKYLEQSTTAAAPKLLQTVRAQFPEKLSGLTFADFQKFDWPALKAKWIAEANKAAQNAKSTDAAKASANSATWLSPLNPDVIPRHLHTLAGASWKDAKGVHIDEWLE